MNPVAVLFVLSLAGPLDSPQFAVRESAERQLTSVPIVDCWPAVYALTANKSAEVRERATRWLSKQEYLFAEQWMRRVVAAPLAAMPWREVSRIELSQKDPEEWCSRMEPLLMAVAKSWADRADVRFFWADQSVRHADDKGQLACRFYISRRVMNDYARGGYYSEYSGGW